MLVKVGNTEADVRVSAVMSTPRLGFMDNFACWMQSLVPLGIVPTKVTGAFWGQCLQRVIESHLDECEYILTIDYDTFFTKADVEHLFALAMTFQCDALTGFQTKRDDGRPMITLLGTQDNPPESGKSSVPAEWFAHPVQEVDAMHFGCTVISAAALKRTPKPWFLDEPDPTGSWNDGRTDADMYFWRNFRKAGNRAFVTPRVTLGHGEYKITWPGKTLATPVYQNTHDFLNTDKKPEDSWQVVPK
jgi:hypothetical protein